MRSVDLRHVMYPKLGQQSGNRLASVRTWAYPPPAAPPLIPKVGPCEGWRMQTNVFLSRCAPSAWQSPTVVVDLPCGGWGGGLLGVVI